jgi:hypothetical protein
MVMAELYEQGPLTRSHIIFTVRVENSSNTYLKNPQYYLDPPQTGSKVVTYSPPNNIKSLQVVGFEGFFLFEILPQVYGLFNLMLIFKLLPGSKCIKNLPTGICRIMNKYYFAHGIC